ncbi:hypothetical protein [Paenibacillus thalictri]|uniref:HTH luxR-type domain-containing protein n=1 Tax=Paenibacillus thalictri TaxID=2527873 RepID=A0A4Q9DI73_9BACL|nr:hypothetical protein [Paenibacillus thalictri]TBL71355.1 hypothetical protein EYB31_30135 [Paenibacillus thalictri]
MKPWTENERLQHQEHICEVCPGSLWGEKSICRIHQMSIGQVDDCPEWKVRQANAGPTKVKERGQAYAAYAWGDIEAQIAQIDEEIKDYPWMQREIARLREELEQIDSGLTSRYGIDAAQPKAKGTVSSVVAREVQKREARWQRLKALEEKVKRIELAVDHVLDNRQRTLLECLLQSQKMNAIARHIGVSRQTLYDIKRHLLELLAEHMYGEVMVKEHARVK